jgi:hypothetical protein
MGQLWYGSEGMRDDISAKGGFLIWEWIPDDLNLAYFLISGNILTT